MKKYEPYLKSIVAFFAPLLTDLAATLQTAGPIDWVALGRRACIYFIGALVVWAVPNTPAGAV